MLRHIRQIIRLLLFGEATPSALAGLRPIANSAGYDFVQLSKSACRPMFNSSLDRSSISPSTAECIGFNHHVLDRLKTDRRIRIVILVYAWGHIFGQPESVEAVIDGIVNQPGVRIQNPLQIATLQSLETSIRSLLANGKQVIVMEDVPEFGIDPLLKYRTSRIPIRHAIAMRLGVLDDSDEGLIKPNRSLRDVIGHHTTPDMIATLPGTTMVDLKQEFCKEAGRCIYRKDNTLFYLDHQHLSPAGAEYALRDFHMQPANP